MGLSGIANPEAWIPEVKHSQADCIKAARTMAEFVVLAENDAAKTPDEFDEIMGSFAYASWLSCRERHMHMAMKCDLVHAGMSESDATSLAEDLSDTGYLAEMAGGKFIREHNANMGLWKRPRQFKGGQKRAGTTIVNEKKFLDAILKMAS